MKESRRAPVVCGATTAALFAALAAYIRVNLAYAGTWGQTLALSALFALTAGGAMAAYAALEKPDGRTLALVGGVMALTMAARVSMLDYISSDYQSFLVLWLDAFHKGGFATLGENVGDYNLIYQYILLLISKAPLKDLYLIKLFSVIFDYALALSMARAAGLFAGEKAKVPTLLIVLTLPTVLINGACWGQCDAVYVFFIVMSLCDMKTRKPVRAAAMLAIAFAFKLQTIFFFPIVLLGLIHGEYKPKHALVFALAYLATTVPALIAGRSLGDALVLIVVIYWLMHAKEVTPEMTLDMALFFAIFLPFVMPKIHERYFFMADMLSILYAARRGDRRFVPLLVIGASLISYMPILTRQRPVDERILGLMMLGALIAVSRDLLSAMRQNRRTLAKGGETA